MAKKAAKKSSRTKMTVKRIEGRGRTRTITEIPIKAAEVKAYLPPKPKSYRVKCLNAFSAGAYLTIDKEYDARETVFDKSPRESIQSILVKDDSGQWHEFSRGRFEVLK